LLDGTESARAAGAVALRTVVVNGDEAQGSLCRSAADSGTGGGVGLNDTLGCFRVVVVVVFAWSDDFEIAERDDASVAREFDQRPPRDAHAVPESHDGEAFAPVGVLVPTSHHVGKRSTDPQQAGCLLHSVQDRRLSAEWTWLPNGAHSA